MSSSVKDNGAASKGKQSKIEEKTESTSEQDETQQKNVHSYSRFLIERFSLIFLLETKRILMKIQRCFTERGSQWCSQRIT